MAYPVFTFQRGGTIAIAIEGIGSVAADLMGATCVAVLKPCVGGLYVPGAEIPVAAMFTVTPRPDIAPIGAGWDFVIDDDDSALLRSGTYCTNAAITFADGAVQVTDPLFVTIEQAALA